MLEHLIYLPSYDNKGNNTAAAREAWEAEVFATVGGYTQGGARKGCWRDDKGVVYNESVIPYYVACSPNAWAVLVAAAFKLFPDQLAIYHAITGDATIAERTPEAATVSPVLIVSADKTGTRVVK